MSTATIAAARIIFLDIFAYRSVLLFWAVFDALYPLSLIFFWLTVYGGQSTVAGLTQEQMVLYYVGILIVTTTVSVHGEWDVQSAIRSGDIKMFLTRPIPYGLFFTVEALIWRMYSASISVPLAFLIVYGLNTLAGLEAPYPVSWQFALALAGSFGVFVSMALCLGYMAFYLDRVNGIIHANTILRSLASGSLLPLTLFPAWAASIAHVLPYRWQYDFPVSVLIGTVQPEDFWPGIGAQWLWTVGFSLLAAALWSIGLRRYDAPEQIGRGE